MVKKAGKLNMGTWSEGLDAFRDAYGEGREEWSKAYREGRKSANKSENAPRIDEMTGAYPTGIRIKEALDDLRGKRLTPTEASNRLIRDDLGIGPKQGVIPRGMQIAGTLANDLTNDNTRNFYWLLNAAQATGNVIAEKALALANKNLYGKSPVMREVTVIGPGNTKKVIKQPINRKDKDIPAEYMTGDTPKKGISFDDEGNLLKRNYNPGDLGALMIPTGVAINTGLGLMTPFGGAEGYWAALPSEDDPTKTSNVLGEVALKYFMGKTGNLLPYDEFSKVRPDVSPEEYGQYQGWKYRRGEDWNPFDDGQTSMGAGLIRTTNEGIHGPELQFMGRSLPLTTGIIPYASALAGGIAGVTRPKPIRGGLVGGLGGLAAGQVVGQLLEGERRRRNALENENDKLGGNV